MSALRPTARGWASIAMALICVSLGWWARYPGLLGFGVVLALAVIVAIIGVLIPAPVSVQRRVKPARVARLQDCHADITVTNSSTWMGLRLQGADRVGGEQVPFDVPALQPGDASTTEVPIPTSRRGVIDFGPLTLRRTSMFSLVERVAEHGSRTSVLVEPAVLDAVSMPAGSRRGHIGADERIASGGTDLVGLRGYIPGDDLRRLHWATSARRGELMIREDADPAAPHLTVMLDDAVGTYDGEEFEEAVDAAASLLATAAIAQSPARLVTTSGKVELDLPAPTSGVAPAGLDPKALGVLARIELDEHQKPGSAYVSSPDILAVVTGTGAPMPEHVSTAAGAPAGIVLVVDPTPTATIGAAGSVVVLRGARAQDLIHHWRRVVAQ